MVEQQYVIKAERQQYAEQSVDLKTLALTRAPNYQHTDGRIYASKAGDPYVAVSVSPYNPKFLTQLEPGIAPVVMAVVERGYLPVSSCEGHSISFSFPYVMVAFGQEDSARAFEDHFRHVPWVTTERASTVANVFQDQKRYQRLDPLLHTAKAEYDDMNRMFNRSYDRYWYVTVKLFETRRGISNIWSNWKTERLRRRFNKDGLDMLHRVACRLPYHIG
jgi:hypothetical protein